MTTLAGYPYVALRFDKTGAVISADGVRPPDGITDLVVISHGWHQDPDDAEGMYEAMLNQVKALGGLPAGRTLGVTGIYWPSDQFKDDMSQETIAVLGAAAAASGSTDADLVKLQKRAADLGALFGMDPAKLSGLATYAATGGAADADDLVVALRAAVGGAGQTDAETEDEHAEQLDPKVRGRDIIQQLRLAGFRGASAATKGGAAAAALGVGGGSDSPAMGLLSGPVAAVAGLLNQFAYFELKKRAGKVGAALGGLLTDAALGGVQRVHLVGHSFGGRLVTSAASATATTKLHSLTLLQGAFSHNALGVDIKPGMNGAFRNVVAQRKPKARIAITHTWNDHAVGVAYAIASRASNDIAAGLVRVTDQFGGAKDIHGGMGANGALRLQPGEGSEATYDGQGAPAMGAYVNNLKCDFIKSHSDIRTPGVARVMLAAFQ